MIQAKHFFISLLPDYNQLNDDEKIYFRLLTLQLFLSISRKKSQNLQPSQLPQVPYLSSRQSVMNPSYHFQRYPSPMSSSDMQAPLHAQGPLHMQTSFHQMQTPAQLKQAPSPVQAPTPVEAPSSAQTSFPVQGSSNHSPTPIQSQTPVHHGTIDTQFTSSHGFQVFDVVSPHSP